MQALEYIRLEYSGISGGLDLYKPGNNKFLRCSHGRHGILYDLEPDDEMCRCCIQGAIIHAGTKDLVCARVKSPESQEGRVRWAESCVTTMQSLRGFA